VQVAERYEFRLPRNMMPVGLSREQVRFHSLPGGSGWSIITVSVTPRYSRTKDLAFPQLNPLSADSPLQFGRINGLPFVASYFTPTNDPNAIWQGQLEAFDGDHHVTIRYDTRSSEAVAALRAATLTIRRIGK
jgi:hypothetical protein